MVYRPQHVGKCVVLHQICIFEKPEEAVLLLFERVTENGKVMFPNIDADRICRKKSARGVEIPVAPVHADAQLIRRFAAVRWIISERE